MSQENKISATLSQQVKDAIYASIESIKNNLGDVLTHALDASDRQALVQLGDKTVAFVEKTTDYAQLNPSLVPPYLDVNEMAKDLTLVQDLRPIYNQLAALTTAVEDAIMLGGSEAYHGALIFYKSLPGAVRSNVPGSATILEDLKKRFPRGKRPDAPKM